jgi:uncharacterized membrane protein YfcA
MKHMKTALFIALAITTVSFIVYWVAAIRKHAGAEGAGWMPGPVDMLIGFATNFFDTLGIGSFAPTTAIFKLRNLVRDEQIPGTLNVGHTMATVAEAFIFIAIVTVDATTLFSMIAASSLGAWLGAGVVARWPRKAVQIGMGLALVVAAGLMLHSQLSPDPVGGTDVGVTGLRLGIAVAASFVLGALMTLGIGLFAPCMILVTLLGMNPKVAFPIMMGSCAFLMPVGSIRFIRERSYNLKSALGLAFGGIPGVLIAAYIVKELSLRTVKWLVIVVVIYTAIMMLRSAMVERARRPVVVMPSIGN